MMVQGGCPSLTHTHTRLYVFSPRRYRASGNITYARVLDDRMGSLYDNSTTFKNLEECYCQDLSYLQMLGEAFFVSPVNVNATHTAHTAHTAHNANATQLPAAADGSLARDPFYDAAKFSKWVNFYEPGEPGEGMGKDWCVTWFLSNSFMQGILLFASMFTVSMNLILKLLMKKLVNVERPMSDSAYYASVFKKVVTVQVINTGLVTIIVNGNLDAIMASSKNDTSLVTTASSIFFSGDHRDMNARWYADVGVTLLLNMLISLACVPIFPVLAWGIVQMKRARDQATYCFCCFTKDTKGDGHRLLLSGHSDQHDLNNLYLGPDFHMATQYATLMTGLFVALFYSAGMPGT